MTPRNDTHIGMVSEPLVVCATDDTALRRKRDSRLQTGTYTGGDMSTDRRWDDPVRIRA